MIEVAPELLAFLKEEYDRCHDSDLEDQRTTAIDRYNGAPYGDEEAGSSQVVARDTAETIDYMVISILRTLISGERVVEFVHKNADAAHEATETIMHLLMDEQDGYLILHDWLKAGLLEKNAVAMTYPEPQPKKRVEKVTHDPEGEGAIEAESVGVDPETGLEMFRCIVMQEQGPKFCDAAVPNEEAYCSPDGRTLDEATLKGRRVRKSLSDLVEMGYERDEVEGITSNSNFANATANARDEDRFDGSSARSGMARMVWWHEEYVRFDANGDGIAEMLYVQRTEDYKVFAVEELEDEADHPFVDWCPFPMPHRRIGQSLADKVMDLERIRTILMRQSLDGAYLSNNPSTYLHEDSIGENTVDDLLTVRAGRVVRWKGAIPPVERSGNFDPSAGFQMLEFMNRERETRTGITRLNMGLDEDTLNQTARGQAQLIARGEQVEEYVARNFANAVARLITKKARLLQRHGQPITVPIDGEFVEVNPSAWPEDMIARARVGLGATRKDQRIAFRREIIAMQAQAFEAGLGIVDELRFYNSAKGFVTEAGLGDVSEYFVEPPKDEQGNPIPKPPQPDPEMAKAQAQMQIEQAKVQAKMQSDAAAHQAEMTKAQARHQLEQGTAIAKIQLQQAESDAKAALERDRATFEAQLAQQKMAFEQQLAAVKLDIERQNQAERNAYDHKMSQNREGGDLSK